MEKQAHLKINLSTRELDVEGSEDFVSKYEEKFEEIIEEHKDENTAEIQDPISESISVEFLSKDQAQNEDIPEALIF